MRPLSTASAVLVAALLGQPISFSADAPGSRNKLDRLPQTGGVRIQGTVVDGITSAVVNFSDLAKQPQSLQQRRGEPRLKVAPEPGELPEVSPDDIVIERANGAAPVDLPGLQIPSPGPVTNFAGLDDIPDVEDDFYVIPPDTTGAVSSDSINRVFTTLNNNYRVQTKSGVQVSGDVSMSHFWAAVGAFDPFDPRVQYDPYNQRWIVAAVSNADSVNTSILVGISQTSDPAGNYFLFKVPARKSGDPANVNFADFPMVGFNKNWVVVTINMFTTNDFRDGRALVINYPAFRTGTLSHAYFTGITNGGACMHPATTYSPTENTEYLVAHVNSSTATYTMHSITGSAAAPVFTTGTFKTRPGGGWRTADDNLLPQARGTCNTTPLRLESTDSNIRSNVVFRNNSIWYAQTIGLPAGALAHTAVQWTQLTRSGEVVQGGRIEDPAATATNGGKWYDYPSIAVNLSNDVVIGFSQFSSSQFASAGYAYRDHSDPLGTMRQPVIYKMGQDCYSKDFGDDRNRWGDFSHTMVDPTNDCAFWTIQEYAKPQALPAVSGSKSKWGTWWAKINAVNTCSIPAPTAPSANTATNVGSNHFTANWNAGSGATGYRLDVSTSNTFNTFVTNYQNLNVNNVTSFTVANLAANTTYYYRVRAYNAGGTSDNSNTIQVLTGPAAPVANAATNVTTTTFTASWGSVGGAIGYRLDVSTVSSFSTYVAGYQNLDVGNATTRLVNGLAAGGTYYYRVRAYNTQSPSNNSNLVTVVTVPAAPLPDTPSNIGARSFIARWNASLGASTYRLDVSTSNTFATFLTGYNDHNVGNLTSFGVKGTIPNTTYYYRVRAANQSGTSGNSNVMSAHTGPAPSPTPRPSATPK